MTSHPKRPRAQLAIADPRGFGVAVGDSPYPPAPTRTTTFPIPDNTPTINLLILILPISGGHRVGAVTAPSGASSRRPGSGGGPSQPPRSSASPSGGRRPGEERLDTEKPLSRASGMNPSPAPDSTAWAGSNPHPMAVSAPPRNSGKDGGVPGGPGEGPRNSGGADGVPSGGQVPPRLLHCPVPRRPPDLSRWEAPATPLELPECALRDAFSAIPMERRADPCLRRGRRLPGQVPFPAGVRCDLPAILTRKDGPGVSALHELLPSGYEELEMDQSVTVVASEWCVLPRPNSGGADAPLNHARVREEFRLRGAFEFLVHGARGEFSLVPPEARGQHFPSTPEWWPQAEFPCGFPARMPQVVAYFGSHLRGSSKGHRVYACVAKHWVVEVTRA